MSPTKLPAAPFAYWLHDLVDRLGQEEVRARLRCAGEAMTDLLAIEPGDEIRLTVVDRCLTRADVGDSLATLYPEAEQTGTRRPHPARGRSYVCDEPLIAIAHSMHLDGMSARQVAREIFKDCYSASPNALAASLLNTWHARGWEVRPQGEATAAANQQRAFRPRCTHVHKLGARRGQHCNRSCSGNDQTCWKHNPERIATRVDQLRTEYAHT